MGLPQTKFELCNKAGNRDTLRLVDISKENIWLRQNDYDLEISILGTQDKIFIRGWYLSQDYQIEQFELKNGTLSADQITRLTAAMAISPTPLGSATEWASNLYFTYILQGQAFHIYLQDSDASQLDIKGSAFNDVIYGNRENNILSGEAGDDILAGKKGDDIMNGGKGNDRYIFALGDGHDTIIDFDETSGNLDILELQNIAQENLWLRRNDNDLEISILGTSDKLTISNWYLGSANQVERLDLINGKTLNAEQISNLAVAMAISEKPKAPETRWPTTHHFSDILSNKKGIIIDLNSTTLATELEEKTDSPTIGSVM